MGCGDTGDTWHGGTGAPLASILPVRRGPTSRQHGDMGYTLGLAAAPKDPLSLDTGDRGTHGTG